MVETREGLTAKNRNISQEATDDELFVWNGSPTKGVSHIFSKDHFCRSPLSQNS